MRQNNLKINSYTKNISQNISIVNNSNLQKRILNTLLFSLGILAVSYIFIIANITLNIIERKALLENEHNLANVIGGLELKYLSLSSKIDLNLAYSMGFKEAKASFAVRKSLELASTTRFGTETVANNSIKLAKNEF